MKNRRVFLRVGKQKRSENLELVHIDVWGPAHYYVTLLLWWPSHILVALIIMLLLLMVQLEKLGFITLDRNLMCLKLLRSGKIWLRIRHENVEMS